MKTRNIVVACAVALCAAQAFAIADAAQFKFKKGINLSRLESWNTTSAGYLNQDSTYTALKAKGFDHIRLPVYFKNYYDSSSQTLKSNISTIDGILDKCEANGFYVFLDFHGWSSINTTNGTDRVDFLKIWELLADRYKNRSDYVIYELLNEPHDTEGGNLNAANLNALQAEVMPLIRQHDPNRLVLLAAAEWNGPWKLPELTIPANSGRIGVVCHTYAPMDFTHQGATWGGHSMDHVSFSSTNKTSTGTADLDNAFRWIDDFQEKTGVPVVMNEFGVYQHNYATDAETLDWTSYVARNCESNGVAWSWWEYNSGFGVYNNGQWRAPVMNGLFPAEPAGNTYASSFNAADYAKKLTITFPGYAGGSALADFPVLVKLSTAISGFSYADFKRTNGDDLRFTDSNGNLIPHEVDTWNSNGVSTVWVKVPSLTASTQIKAYYGCTLPVEVDSSKVWSNGYVGVWHLGEKGLPLRESSQTSTDFTKMNGSVQYAATGIVGGSVNFGNSGYRRMLSAHDCDALDGFTNFTVEAWTYQTSNTTAAILSKRYSSSKNRSYFLYANGTTTQFNVSKNDSTSDSSAQITPTLNQWSHQAYTFAAGTIKGYKDGAKVGSDKTVSFSTINTSDGYLHLGNFNRDGAWNADTRNFPGRIDEVRISNVARSADWMQATYDTVKKDSFAAYTFGEVPAPVEYGPLATNLYAKSMNVAFAGVQAGVVLTNFPVLVKLSTAIDGFSYSDFTRANGEDLRFADADGNLLPHEIDTWNPSGVSTVWVKVPLLKKPSYITAHYGFTGSGDPAPVDPKDVWDSDYKGVWHLSAAKGATVEPDSTANGRDFSVSSSYSDGVAAGTNGVAGLAVASGLRSDGKGCFNQSDSDYFFSKFGAFTMEVWAYQDDHDIGGQTDSRRYMLSHSSDANTDWQIYEAQSGKHCIRIHNLKSQECAVYAANNATKPPRAAWNHTAFSWDGSNGAIGLYLNGSSLALHSDVGAASAWVGQMTNSQVTGFSLGNYRYENSSGLKPFKGLIDEVRISKVPRSAAWIKATHDTIADAGFAVYSFGEIDYGENITNLLLKASTDKENPIDYVEGEQIRFDFRLDGVAALPLEVRAKAPLHVVWTRVADDGVTVKGTNTISLAQGFSVTTRLAIPGIVKMTGTLVGSDYKAISFVNPADGKTKNITFGGGAGVATEKMQLSTVEPADFDQFWAEAKQKLATVPFNEQNVELVNVTPSNISNSYVIYAAKIPCFGPRPVTGWLTIPKNAKPGTLPIQANFDGYGCASAKPNPPTYGAGKVMRLAINAHGYDLVGHDNQYYKDFNDYINKTNRTFNGTTYGYACAPQDYDNPTNTYFYYMAMRVMRAYDYLKSRPEWDGTNVWASGGSQGGLQTMWAGGLVDGITKISPSITWGCDIGCPFNGKGTYPSRTWGIPCVPGAYYFDSALHAKRVPRGCIANITRLGMGDYTCPPRGVLLSYYNMKCQVSAYLVQGSDHGYTPPQPNQVFTISKAAEPEPPTPLPAVAADSPGFDYTNRVVTVTNATAGAVLTLTATASDGTTTTATATVGSNGEATFNIATVAGSAYDYTIANGDDTIATGGFFTGGWDASGSLFSAAPDGSGVSVEANGEWTVAPAGTNATHYAVDEGADFALSADAAAATGGELVRVDVSVKYDSFDDVGTLSSGDLDGRTFGIAPATEGGEAKWMVGAGGSWKPLAGGPVPQTDAPYVLRMEADFKAVPPKVRCSVSSDDGVTFDVLSDIDGNSWHDVSKSALSGVAFDGRGDVASLRGALANANVAEADGVGYASLADAIAAATNTLTLLTNATWPTNTPIGTTALNLGGYALQGVTLDGSGKAVVQSGYSAIPGEGRVNITLTQAAALGVATANKTPAQIAAALAADGANGIPLWKSYVLGLDPAVATSTPKATIAMDGENVVLSLVGIDVNEDAGATVTYKVYKFADLANMAAAEAVGADRDVDVPAQVQKDASEPKMFYRLKVDVKGY